MTFSSPILTKSVMSTMYGATSIPGHHPARPYPHVPYIVDITDFVSIGDENVIDYDACRVVGNNCVTPPTCQGDGYCPEIAMSSYLIISY